MIKTISVGFFLILHIILARIYEKKIKNIKPIDMNKRLPSYNHFLVFLLFFIFSFTSNQLIGQIVISEFSAANQGDFINADGDDNTDWIELHNQGSTSVDIGGYYLSDKLGNPTKWEIPAGTMIPANGYITIWASGLDGNVGFQLQTNFKITQTRNNEDIVLADPSGTVIDFHELDVPNQIHHSYAKDANGNWGVSTSPTQGGANGSVFTGGYAEKPDMTPDAGFYTAQVTVSFTIPAETTVYYTTDGSRPNNTSTIVTGDITLTQTTVLRAVAYHVDGTILPSFYKTNTYFVDDFHTVPVVSVSGGSEIDNLLDGNFIEPLGYFELFDENQEEVDEGQGYYNKHGNDSWNYPQRGFDWIMRDQTGYDDEVSGQIFEQKDRTEYQRLIFKAAANDNYTFQDGAHVRDAYVHTLSQLADLEMDERTSKFCVVYVNGEYWGVYDMREKVDDHDFTKYYYDQGRVWIDFIKTWGGTWVEYGSMTDFIDLRAFVLANDMTDPDNYTFVSDRLEIQSLIDYVLLHQHIVSKDWLNWNTAFWRGRKPTGGAQKWRYILWDEDATFGHYFNYTNIPDDSPTADPCNVEIALPDIYPEGHIEMFNQLYMNENFKQNYINRYADLNSTFFSCDYMIPLLDSMVAVIEPEMQRQIDTWGGTYGGWESNVQELRDFITTRCSFIDGGIVDCYDVTGPFPLEVIIEPMNSPNKVKVNTIVPNAFPYQGDYYGGVNISLEAQPAINWTFDHWEVANQTFGPDQFAMAIEVGMEMGDTIVAFFQPGVPCAKPTSLIADPSMFGVNFTWNPPTSTSTISYEARYREVGTNSWTSISTEESEYSFEGLDACTDYELEVRSICQSALSEFITVAFQTACTTNTSELDGSNIANFKAFPNPFSDHLNVEFDLAQAENITIELHTLHGQLVMQETKGKLAGGNHLISVPMDSNWSDGMYLLRIVSEKGSVVKRVMKTN